MLKIKAYVWSSEHPHPGNSYGLAQSRVRLTFCLPGLRGPLSIKRLAAMCAPTTFTDWKDFSHPTLKLFKKLPASLYNPS